MLATKGNVRVLGLTGWGIGMMEVEMGFESFFDEIMGGLRFFFFFFLDEISCFLFLLAFVEELGGRAGG